MKMIQVASVIFATGFCVHGVFSQTSTYSDPRDPRPAYMKNIDDGRARQELRVKRAISDARAADAPTSRRVTIEERRAEESKKREALNEINSLLSAPPEYRVRYAEFLKAKNTGLVRVFPERGCDKGIVVSVADLERCGGTAPIQGAGSLFSFRLNKLPDRLSLDHILFLIRQSDIHFTDGKFVVGTDLIQDIISDLGEVSLDEVTLNAESLKFLRSFKPGNTAAKVAAQNQELAKDISSNGFTYSTSVKIALDHTYVLRSIAFRPRSYRTHWNTDELTAFKVIGQEKDGSVVLLWKELKESEAPTLND